MILLEIDTGRGGSNIVAPFTEATIKMLIDHEIPE